MAPLGSRSSSSRLGTSGSASRSRSRAGRPTSPSGWSRSRSSAGWWTAPNAVEVYVGYLRRKLGRDVLETVRGAGYRLVPSLP